MPIYRLDGKGTFAAGLFSIRQRLNERFYPSVASFSADLASLFTSEIGVGPAGDTAELQAQISGRAPELSIEQREKRKLAKRIIKAIQPALEDAIRKESELNRKPFEKELKELDVILDHSVLSAEPEGDTEFDIGPHDTKPEAMEGVEPTTTVTEDTGEDKVPPETQAQAKTTELNGAPNGEEAVAPGEAVAEPELVEEIKPNAGPIYRRHPTPVLTEADQRLPLAQGGIQWYMQPFDPIGTTIHEERWTGRDVMRGMSEELSELDEDELKDLVEEELDQDPTKAPAGVRAGVRAGAGTGAAGNSQQVRRTRRRR
jgi:NuA3 HAT complex component NTO1